VDTLRDRLGAGRFDGRQPVGHYRGEDIAQSRSTRARRTQTLAVERGTGSAASASTIVGTLSNQSLPPPAIDPHPIAITAADEAKAVVLGLVGPARPVGDGAGEHREAWLDEADGPWRAGCICHRGRLCSSKHLPPRTCDPLH
jgi:hypothetical protein